jgi:tetratricopeptide (TPR) repeat protein
MLTINIKSSYQLIIFCLLAFIIIYNIPGCNFYVANKYLNLSSEARYVGITACKNCHQDIYHSYIQTGMGRSLYLPDTAPLIESFDDNYCVYDSIGDFYYKVYKQNNEYYIQEFRLRDYDTVHNITHKVKYIIGSGNQTRSYLIERNKFIFEAPVTWYVAKQKWDLSPGYENGNNSRFSRPIGTECINCHNAYTQTINSTFNQYDHIPLGIDCERCHGPGSIHVAKMEKDEIVDITKEIDYSIVNPAKLATDLQFDVCQQCHLQGINVYINDSIEFRPGMTLSQVREIFLEKRNDPNLFGIASHAERLRQSQCFQQSNSKLTCTTCHDPHKPVKSLEANYIQNKCINCHTQKVCKLSESQRLKKSCTTCHMPPGGTRDIPHVKFTDHFIRVVQKPILKSNHNLSEQQQFLGLLCATNSNPDKEIVGKAQLAYFEQFTASTNWLDSAINYLLSTNSWEALARAYYFKADYINALQVIEKITNIKYHTVDKAVSIYWLAGEILEKLNRYAEAQTYFERILLLRPQHTEANRKMGILTLKRSPNNRQALEKASHFFTQALIQKPFDPILLTNLAFVKLNQGNAMLADSLLKLAINESPDYLLALENSVITLLTLNQKKQAAIIAEKILKLEPNHAQKSKFLEIMNYR